MRIRMVAFAFVISALLISAITLGQETRWLMHGTVTWSTGTRAASVKMVLLQNRQRKAIVYTNQQGRYGFFGIQGRPSDYVLEVWFYSRLLKTFSSSDIRQIQRGGRLDIQLQRR
jgi:hypothetical protein